MLSPDQRQVQRGGLRLVPVTLADCRRFIGKHHRHNRPPVGWRFGVGVMAESDLVGIGVAGHPVARNLDDGLTLEVTRTCTNGAKNANSMIYGALSRAAFALGYRRVITYTLAEEPGSSLKASGFRVDAEVPASAGWSRPSRPLYDVDLFGNEQTPNGPKYRWVREAS